MIKLTEEEIRKIYLDRAVERFGVEAGTQLISQLESINNAQDVAKAQLKKVVEEAKLAGALNPDGSMCSDVTQHYSFWQALLEEVKDD